MKLLFIGTLSLVLGYSWAQRTDFQTVSFIRADSVAAYYRGADLSNLPVLAYQLTNGLSTDVEKFRSIYTWVSNNITNDINDYFRNKRKREKFYSDPQALKEWNDRFGEQFFEKLLNTKKTICTGYAYLVAELSGMAGIQAKIVDGYGRTAAANVEGEAIPNHSWNAVELGNKWYLCDATWSSGSINPKQNEFVQNYNDGYFLAEPKLFALNHYPLDTAWLLTDNKISLEEFVRGPLIYKYAFSNNIRPIYPSEMEIKSHKNEPISFTLEVTKDEVVDDISIEISRGGYTKVLKPDIQKKGTRYNFVCQPSLKGKFDLHIKVGQEYAITYTVFVNKN